MRRAILVLTLSTLALPAAAGTAPVACGTAPALRSAPRSVWLFHADGPRRLIAGGALSAEGARFARDGRHVLYFQHARRNGAPLSLYVLDLATDTKRGPIATIPGDAGYYGLHDWDVLAPWYRPA